jgi:hypothetical protein
MDTDNKEIRKEKARVRAKSYYETNKDEIRRKNLERYYKKHDKEPRIKKPTMEERLGIMYLKEQELSS